jgi:hypothetical protein
VCGIKYSFDEEDVGSRSSTILQPAAQLTRYQVCVTFDPETGAEDPAGGNSACIEEDRQRGGEASSGNTDATILVSQAEWDATHNNVRIVKEQAEFNQRRLAADLSKAITNLMKTTNS